MRAPAIDSLMEMDDVALRNYVAQRLAGRPSEPRVAWSHDDRPELFLLDAATASEALKTRLRQAVRSLLASWRPLLEPHAEYGAALISLAGRLGVEDAEHPLQRLADDPAVRRLIVDAEPLSRLALRTLLDFAGQESRDDLWVPMLDDSEHFDTAFLAFVLQGLEPALARLPRYLEMAEGAGLGDAAIELRLTSLILRHVRHNPAAIVRLRHAIGRLPSRHRERVEAILQRVVPELLAAPTNGPGEPPGMPSTSVDSPGPGRALASLRALTDLSAPEVKQIMVSGAGNRASMRRTRTKIVCTVGPASASAEQLDRLTGAGMDVARLNFSHGTHAEHAHVIHRLRAGESRWGRPIAVLQDLQGPKIRLGTFGVRGGRRVDLEPGALFTLTAEPVVGTAQRVSVLPAEALREVRPGDQVLMDDGLMQLRVEAVEGGEVRCRVQVGGRLSDHKGVALPRVPIPASCLTEKDRADLRFGIEQGIDFVAVSFVRSAADIEEVRAFLRELGADVPIVAKLERQEVIANLPEILPIVDAVMVARGDLGVDVPLEEVPHIQKEVIRQARAARVPVIVATQMLESMTTHARPTRAEVADVTAAIFDGADAIMLSAETASGRFPAQSVDYMARIAARAEEAVVWRPAPRRAESPGFAETISSAAATAAHDLGARAIVAFTETGFSARLISQERPGVPIIALTPHPAVLPRLALCWGLTARVVRKVEGTDEMIDGVEAALLGDGIVRPGDVIVIISGAPMWVRGTTNLLKLHRVGERR